MKTIKEKYDLTSRNINIFEESIRQLNKNIEGEKIILYNDLGKLHPGLHYKIKFKNKIHPEYEIYCIGWDFKYNYLSDMVELIYFCEEKVKTKSGKLKKHLKIKVYGHGLVSGSKLTISSNILDRVKTKPGQKLIGCTGKNHNII